MPVSVQLAALPPLLEEVARDGVESEIGQWAAVASVVTGALMTALGHGGPAPTPHFEWRVVPASAVFGVFVWFAMGVDFPNSSRRFSGLV